MSRDWSRDSWEIFSQSAVGTFRLKGWQAEKIAHIFSNDTNANPFFPSNEHLSFIYLFLYQNVSNLYIKKQYTQHVIIN